jgi:RNA polymerase sigma factor (sigma-70 family)
MSNSDQSSPASPADSRIANGNHKHTVRLLADHEPLIAKQLRRSKAQGLIRRRHQWADARQAARLGFLEAAARFDETRGTTIGAFARLYIKGAVLEALEGDGQQDAVTVPLDTVVPEGDEDLSEEYCSALLFDHDPVIAAEAAEAKAAVSAFVSTLPVPHQQIVRDVFWEGQLQADVARDRGVSRKTITKTLEKVYARGRVALAAYATA